MAKLLGKILLFLFIGLLLLIPDLASPKEDILYRDQVAVLVYHHIDNTAQSDVTITSSRFASQLSDLLSRGYHFISLQQFKQYLNGDPVPPNAVLVTFDDGYESFYTYAFPILSKLSIPAVNFVITKDLAHPQASVVPSLSNEEISAMAGRTPEYDFQCHTDALHDRSPEGNALFTSLLTNNGRTETMEEYRLRIIQDTQTCRRKLQSIQQAEIDSFAYPFGIFNQTSSELIQEAGIHFAFTTVNEIATRTTDPMQIPRINAGSPFIRANSVNNLIVRKIVAPPDPSYRAPLVEIIGDLGGKVISVGSGTAKISLEGETMDVPLASDQTVNLEDLRAILHRSIVYHPLTGLYSVRYTPDRGEAAATP